MKKKPEFARRRCSGWSSSPCMVWFVPRGPRHRRCDKCKKEYERRYERLREDKKFEGPTTYRKRPENAKEFGSVRMARESDAVCLDPKAAIRFLDTIINLS